eukprot:5728703-Pyramimonas_sp.AAC.1
MDGIRAPTAKVIGIARRLTVRPRPEWAVRVRASASGSGGISPTRPLRRRTDRTAPTKLV